MGSSIFSPWSDCRNPRAENPARDLLAQVSSAIISWSCHQLLSNRSQLQRPWGGERPCVLFVSIMAALVQGVVFDCVATLTSVYLHHFVSSLVYFPLFTGGIAARIVAWCGLSHSEDCSTFGCCWDVVFRESCRWTLIPASPLSISDSG